MSTSNGYTIRAVYFDSSNSTTCGMPDRKSFSIDNMINSKIKFDVSQLDKDGLAGSEDSTALPMNFAFPTPACTEIRLRKLIQLLFYQIPGRSMCDKNQTLFG